MGRYFIAPPVWQGTDDGRTLTRSSICIALAVAAPLAPAAAQQVTNTRDVRQAYGSRLDQGAVPEVSRGIVHRLDTRVSNRINNRLNTRVERYRTTIDPIATLRDNPLERTTSTPVLQTPLPPVPE